MTENFFQFSNGGVEIKDEISPDIVGFKAFNLMRMAKIGLPIPPGFVIDTRSCHDYYSNNRQLTSTFELQQNIQKLEKVSGFTFGGQRKPLLVSVRSGAAVSMPGMMDTILNIGLSHETVNGLLRMTGNPRFVWDSYRRLIQTFAEVVYSCSSNPYEELLSSYIENNDLNESNEIDSETLKKIVDDYLDIFLEQTNIPFPQRPIEQLQKAIEAVFNSWQSARCIEYRNIHKIENLLGTSVTIQTMVFGNMGILSGSGVAFTRDPSTGENKLYGEFIFNSQGEDLVSGKYIPQGLEKLGKLFPNIQRQLNIIGKRLEIEFKDMQDFEFTVQEGNLFILQTRRGMRTPWAALQIAFDMVNEGLINTDIALDRLKIYDLADIKKTKINFSNNNESICTGLSANPGVTVGEIVFDSEKVKEGYSLGKSMILVRDSISASDISGITFCEGILTTKGGKTSHAAVVARQMNKVCIVGCSSIIIDIKNRKCFIDNRTLNEGDFISLDGNTGTIYNGKVNFQIDKPEKLISEIQKWKITGN